MDIVIIPCFENNKKMIKWIRYLNKILYDNNYDSVVISNTLKQIEGINECISKENINILNGTILKENLLVKITEYIANKINENINNLEVTLLINDNKKSYIEGIINLAERVKNIKIVTNNEQEFKFLEQRLQELYGILIRITNNKRKGLVNSGIIINMDFPEELVNKYTINPDAIFVNLSYPVKINSKKFKGINANDIKINMKINFNLEFAKNNIFNDFEPKELYEASICNMTYDKIQNKIKEDNVYVNALIGNNGIINEKEFEEKCKFYVKTIDKMSILN